MLRRHPKVFTYFCLSNSTNPPCINQLEKWSVCFVVWESVGLRRHSSIVLHLFPEWLLTYSTFSVWWRGVAFLCHSASFLYPIIPCKCTNARTHAYTHVVQQPGLARSHWFVAAFPYTAWRHLEMSRLTSSCVGDIRLCSATINGYEQQGLLRLCMCANWQSCLL